MKVILTVEVELPPIVSTDMSKTRKQVAKAELAKFVNAHQPWTKYMLEHSTYMSLELLQ